MELSYRSPPWYDEAILEPKQTTIRSYSEYLIRDFMNALNEEFFREEKISFDEAMKFAVGETDDDQRGG